MGNYCCCEFQNSEPNQKTKIRKKSNKGDQDYKQNKDHYQQIRNQKRSTDNYQSIKYLGRGTFGDVVLTEDKQTHKQYAMKIIDKTKIKQINVLQNRLLQDLSNENILVSVRQTFQNAHKIYLIMEYLSKGDIYFYLKQKEFVFTENIIRDIIAEIIYGLQVLHSHDIIYRQLKPQNILVTNDGHVKLCDYWMSKILKDNKNSISTLVGTLDYIAPEALEGHYGKKSDIWAVGVLMFELKFEKNPFLNSNTVLKSQKMLQNSIESTNIKNLLNENISSISLDFRDLIIGLLNKDPENRYSLKQIKQHLFFKQINWQEVYQRKNRSPLKDFIQKNDHIKFRDPSNQAQFSHRLNKLIGKDNFKTNLYEFRSTIKN